MASCPASRAPEYGPWTRHGDWGGRQDWQVVLRRWMSALLHRRPAQHRSGPICQVQSPPRDPSLSPNRPLWPWLLLNSCLQLSKSQTKPGRRESEIWISTLVTEDSVTVFNQIINPVVSVVKDRFGRNT